MNIEKELRIMHAYELGAVGVYRGHKCVARYFFAPVFLNLIPWIFTKVTMRKYSETCC